MLIFAHTRSQPAHLQQRYIVALMLITVLLIINGCATTPPAPSVTSKPLQQLQHWQLKAKLGVRTSDDSGTVYLNWQQQGEQFRIHLSGPLGQGSAWIEGRPGQVELRQSDGTVNHARSPEALIYRTTGWQVPVSSLKHWLKGQPTDTSRVQQLHRNANGDIESFNQQGWQLNFSRQQNVNGWVLPGKVQARQQQTSLTLIIREWDTNPDLDLSATPETRD